MSYDLAVWEGERLESDEMAEEAYAAFAERDLETEEQRDEPTPASSRDEFGSPERS